MLMHPGELFAAAVWFSMVTWLMLRTREHLGLRRRPRRDQPADGPVGAVVGRLVADVRRPAA